MCICLSPLNVQMLTSLPVLKLLDIAKDSMSDIRLLSKTDIKVSSRFKDVDICYDILGTKKKRKYALNKCIDSLHFDLVSTK